MTGIFHSFTGTSEEAAKLLEFEGFMLGINGVVTFKKSTLPETLTTVPLERIVLETDSPYLGSCAEPGKRNESANVKRHTYEGGGDLSDNSRARSRGHFC